MRFYSSEYQENNSQYLFYWLAHIKLFGYIF